MRPRQSRGDELLEAREHRVRRGNKKGPRLFDGGLQGINSLTMSYFHTGTRNIIGAEAFHCPVRDGKEWDHLAMVIRLNRSLPRIRAGSQFVESYQS